ncbi:MAG: hypothetical protein JWP97_5851 [Labilithrix sp.]|nr:hypothetical protein [Labilithrix sp.]
MKRILGSFLVVAACAAVAACVSDAPAPLPAVDPLLDGGTTDTDGAVTPGDGGVPDANAGDAGPKRFCATQTPAAGVTSFFCADFDGPKIDEGFTTSNVPDGGGKLAPDLGLFHSSPASLVTSGDATMTWSNVGAGAITAIGVELEVNVGSLGGPVTPATGSVSLVRIDTADTRLSLAYGNGNAIDGVAVNGYFISISSCPNACFIVQKAISQMPPPNVWTKVGLAWTSEGRLTLRFNDTKVLEMSKDSGMAAPWAPTTKVSVGLGLVREGTPPVTPSHNFDDLEVSVIR